MSVKDPAILTSAHHISVQMVQKIQMSCGFERREVWLARVRRDWLSIWPTSCGIRAWEGIGLSVGDVTIFRI